MLSRVATAVFKVAILEVLPPLQELGLVTRQFIDPVLSSTSTSSMPLDCRVTCEFSDTLTLLMPKICMKVVFTVPLALKANTLLSALGMIVRLVMVVPR